MFDPHGCADNLQRDQLMVHTVGMNVIKQSVEQFPAVLCDERNAGNLPLLQSLIGI
jgi:hypothetical protein